jgi:hypothetical protein
MATEPSEDMISAQSYPSQYQERHEHSISTRPEKNAFALTPTSMSMMDQSEVPIDPSISMSSIPLNHESMSGIISDIDESSLAEFLRDIMAKGSPMSEDPISIEFSQQTYSSWDVFNFGMESSLEFNDMDLGWINSQNNYAPIGNPHVTFETNDSTVDKGQETPDVQSSISLGAEAFSKSLWNWLPGQREHGWMELSNLSLPHHEIEGLENRPTPNMIDHHLEQSSRDAILAMVLNANAQESGIAKVVTSFPSAQLLNSLMHLFFRSEVLKTDSWIHLPTFHPRSQRPEFNGIVVASGAILSPVPTGTFP